MLGWLQKNPQKKCYPDDQAKKDILVWAGFVKDTNNWKPSRIGIQKKSFRIHNTAKLLFVIGMEGTYLPFLQ